MKFLLDTCTFLWLLDDAPQLSEPAKRAFQDPNSEMFLSAVSCWEIAVKHRLQQLTLPEPPDTYVPSMREALAVEPLPLDEVAALHVSRLPMLHRDPFDRMLVSQGIVEGMVILTPDRAITQYPVRSLW